MSDRDAIGTGPTADDAARIAIAKAAAGELLGPRDMQAIWKISHSQFNRLDHQGAWDHFKVRPAISPRCFSGVLVHRYLSGEPVYVPTFGKKRMSR